MWWRRLTAGRRGNDPLDVRNVSNKDDFVRFVAGLKADFEARPDEWENASVPDYLDAIGQWTRDWTEFERSPNPWRHAATMLWMGRIYE
jgi:hypothetical protein